MTGATFHIGQDGFIWFVGVIESLDDPLRVGRAKVRIFGWHTESRDMLPTAALPWAYPLLPITQSTNVPNYRVGDWVAGFFLDGTLGQQPVIFGVFPAIPQR